MGHRERSQSGSGRGPDYIRPDKREIFDLGSCLVSVPHPQLQGEQVLLTPELCRLFDPQRYIVNCEILKACDKFNSGDPRFQRTNRAYVYPNLAIRPEQAIAVIEGLRTASPVEDTLTVLVKSAVKFPKVQSLSDIDGFYFEK